VKLSHLWNRLTTVAATQDGVVTTDDIERNGGSTAQRQRLVDQRRLERIAPRVFRVAGAPDTHRQRLRAGLLSLGPNSCVSYEAAAELHGLDRSRRNQVEFTIPREHRRGRSQFRLHTTDRSDPTDFVLVSDLRTTSATRTVIDLAHSRAPQGRVEAAMDSAVRLGLSHPRTIALRLETLRGSGRWGCRLIDRLLPDSGGHSPLERRFLQIVRAARLPRPRTQVVHRDQRGRHVARVDFEFVDHELIVEVTGRLGHTSDAERERDAQRRNELQALGHLVIEYTSRQVFDRPWWVASDLKRHLD
jgi:very-short-patch-repair endonuclease